MMHLSRSRLLDFVCMILTSCSYCYFTSMRIFRYLNLLWYFTNATWVKYLIKSITGPVLGPLQRDEWSAFSLRFYQRKH